VGIGFDRNQETQAELGPATYFYVGKGTVRTRMLTDLESRATMQRESTRRFEIHNRAALNVLKA
jgi:hypothetical protein